MLTGYQGMTGFESVNCKRMITCNVWMGAGLVTATTATEMCYSHTKVEKFINFKIHTINYRQTIIINGRDEIKGSIFQLCTSWKL